MRVLVVQVDTRAPDVGAILESTRPAAPVLPGGDTQGRDVPCDRSVSVYRANAASYYPRAVGDVQALTSAINGLACDVLGYAYSYHQAPPLPGRHPAWVKIRHVLDLFSSSRAWDACVMLDTDAWIRDPLAYRAMANDFFADSSKLIALAEEPVCDSSFMTYHQVFNTGFYMFKRHPAVHRFFRDAWSAPDDVPQLAQHKLQWSWEQVCMNYVYGESPEDVKRRFLLLPLHGYNTPAGAVVRHSWAKDIAAELATRDLVQVALLRAWQRPGGTSHIPRVLPAAAVVLLALLALIVAVALAAVFATAK